MQHRAPVLIALALGTLVGACGGSNGSSALLCTSCAADGDCGGAPCFADKSGARFCGAPCDACPAGFSCQPVTGTDGQVAKTCFPDNASCAMTPVGGNDLAAGGGSDGGGGGGPDLAGPVSCAVPAGGTVSLSGGTVDRLFFGYTGDTRPAVNSTGYPTALATVIGNIFTQMGQKGVSFALDGGDHMEASTSSEAQANMADYLTAAAKLGKPVFMTMGNHECSKSLTTDCGSGTYASDIKGAAYMSALQQSIGATKPYYRFDVNTATGKAVFIVIADDAWDATQQAWLTAQLTDADAHAKYTFVSKHHPDGNTDQTYFQTIYNLVTSHKYTLFLTGHSHEYKRQPTDRRAVVMGLGGAPFDNPNQMWWGYLTVMQCSDDHIYVNVYDQATGMLKDSFNVPPQ